MSVEEIKKEFEAAINRIMARKWGVEEPTRWLDVADGYINYYTRVKDKIIEAIGGYENIERFREYPATPTETYAKFYITVHKPVKLCFQMENNYALKIDDKAVPLFIDERAFTPLGDVRIWEFREPTEKMEQFNKDLKRGKKVCLSIEREFFVQIDNPATYSRIEGKMISKPPRLIIGIYD